MKGEWRLIRTQEGSQTIDNDENFRRGIQNSLEETNVIEPELQEAINNSLESDKYETNQREKYGKQDRGMLSGELFDRNEKGPSPFHSPKKFDSINISRSNVQQKKNREEILSLGEGLSKWWDDDSMLDMIPVHLVSSYCDAIKGSGAAIKKNYHLIIASFFREYLVKEQVENFVERLDHRSKHCTLSERHNLDQLYQKIFTIKTCTICYQGFNATGRKPFVTSCGHCICESCNLKCNPEKCWLCRKPIEQIHEDRSAMENLERQKMLIDQFKVTHQRETRHSAFPSTVEQLLVLPMMQNKDFSSIGDRQWETINVTGVISWSTIKYAEQLTLDKGSLFDELGVSDFKKPSGDNFPSWVLSGRRDTQSTVTNGWKHPLCPVESFLLIKGEVNGGIAWLITPSLVSKPIQNKTLTYATHSEGFFSAVYERRMLRDFLKDENCLLKFPSQMGGASFTTGAMQVGQE